MILEINKTFKALYITSINCAKKELPLFFNGSNLGGSRIGGKTFSCLMIGILVGLIKPTHIYAIRLIKEDLKQTLIGDCLKIFKQINRNYDYKVSDGVIYFGNNSKISFIGLKKNRKEKLSMSGMASNENFLYGFKIKDEIIEWQKQEEQAVDEAIRGFRYGYIIDCKSINAFDLKNHYSNELYQKFEQIIPDFEHELMTKHFVQYAEYSNFINPLNNEKKIWREFNLITAYRSNPFADLNVVKQLMKLEKEDPVRARVACYGLQGAEYEGLYKIQKFLHFDNSIFKNFLNNNFPRNEIITEYRVGFDYGWNDKTAAVLIGISKKIIYILDIFVYDRKKQAIIDDWVLAQKLANTLDVWKTTYKFTKCYFKYDYSNKTFPMLLSKFVDHKNVYYVTKCQKGNLADRISILTYLFANKQIKFNQSKSISLKPLKNELISSKRKESPGDFKGVKKDGNDDIINALEYALDNKLVRELIGIEELNYILNKNYV